MEYHLRTKLNGNIAMTSCFHENSFLQRDRSLINLYGCGMERWMWKWIMW